MAPVTAAQVKVGRTAWFCARFGGAASAGGAGVVVATASDAGAWRESVPSVAVTVKGYVPGATPVAVMVIVLDPGTATEAGAKPADAPAGSPAVPSVTVPVYPFAGVTETAAGAVPVPQTPSADGDTPTAKSAPSSGRSTKRPPVWAPLMPDTITVPLAKNG